MQCSLPRECEVEYNLWEGRALWSRFRFYLFIFFWPGFAVTRQVFTVEVLGRLVLFRFQGPIYWSSQWIKNMRYLFQDRRSTVFLLSDSFRTMSGSLHYFLFQNSCKMHTVAYVHFPMWFVISPDSPSFSAISFIKYKIE